MSTPDNFNFADIPAPSTPVEKRFVELVRGVVRDELSKFAFPKLPRPEPFTNGCICPPASEKTCRGPGCPRRSIGSAA
jgi:hypothetical protein